MPDGNRAKGIARLGIKHDSPRCAAVECGKKLSINVIGHVWGIGNCFMGLLPIEWVKIS
jgi:hypothetical protein